MDFGRIIIGLFLVIHSPYKFWNKKIKFTRMFFSVVFGLAFLMKGITYSSNYSMGKYISKEQMVYWDYLGQFLNLAMILLLVRYFWELWKAKRVEA